MSESDVIANTLEGLEFAITKLKGGWNDVTCIHLKTSDSPALPIYNKTDSEMMNFVKAKANIPEQEQKVAKKTTVKETLAVETKGKKVKAVRAVVIEKEEVAAPVVKGKGKAKTAEAASSSKKAPEVEKEVEVEEEIVKTKVVKKTVTSTKKRKAEVEAEGIEEPVPKVVKKAGKKAPVKK